MSLATSVHSRRRQVEPSVANAIHILPDDTNHKFICAWVRFLTFIFKCCANVLSLRRIAKRRVWRNVLWGSDQSDFDGCHVCWKTCLSFLGGRLCLACAPSASGPINLFTFESQIFWDFFFFFVFDCLKVTARFPFLRAAWSRRENGTFAYTWKSFLSCADSQTADSHTVWALSHTERLESETPIDALFARCRTSRERCGIKVKCRDVAQRWVEACV